MDRKRQLGSLGLALFLLLSTVPARATHTVELALINEFRQSIDVRFDYKSGHTGGGFPIAAGESLMVGSPRGDAIEGLRVYAHGKLVYRCDSLKGDRRGFRHCHLAPTGCRISYDE